MIILKRPRKEYEAEAAAFKQEFINYYNNQHNHNRKQHYIQRVSVCL